MTQNRDRRRESGASAVEFALIVPLLLGIVFAIMEFGLALNQQISLTQAAREGARHYAIHHADPGFNQALLASEVAAAAPALVPGTYSVSSAPATGCPSGTNVTVTVTSTFQSLTGWFDWASLNLAGKGTVRCGG